MATDTVQTEVVVTAEVTKGPGQVEVPVEKNPFAATINGDRYVLQFIYNHAGDDFRSRFPRLLQTLIAGAVAEFNTSDNKNVVEARNAGVDPTGFVADVVSEKLLQVPGFPPTAKTFARKPTRTVNAILHKVEQGQKFSSQTEQARGESVSKNYEYIKAFGRGFALVHLLNSLVELGFVTFAKEVKSAFLIKAVGQRRMSQFRTLVNLYDLDPNHNVFPA